MSACIVDIHRAFNSLNEDLFDHLIVYQKNMQASSASRNANLAYLGFTQSLSAILLSSQNHYAIALPLSRHHHQEIPLISFSEYVDSTVTISFILTMLISLYLILQQSSGFQSILSWGLRVMNQALGASMARSIAPIMKPHQHQLLSDPIYQGKLHSLNKLWGKLKISLGDINKGKYIIQWEQLKHIQSHYQTGTMMLTKLHAQGQATLSEVINIRKLGWRLEAEIKALTPVNPHRSIRLFNQNARSQYEGLKSVMHRLGFY